MSSSDLLAEGLYRKFADFDREQFELKAQSMRARDLPRPGPCTHDYHPVTPCFSPSYSPSSPIPTAEPVFDFSPSPQVPIWRCLACDGAGNSDCFGCNGSLVEPPVTVDLASRSADDLKRISVHNGDTKVRSLFLFVMAFLANNSHF